MASHDSFFSFGAARWGCFTDPATKKTIDDICGPGAPPALTRHARIGARWPKTVTRSSGSEPIEGRWLKKNNDADASRFPDPVFHCGRVLASLAERPAKTVKRDPDKVRRLVSAVALPRRWGRYQERR